MNMVVKYPFKYAAILYMTFFIICHSRSKGEVQNKPYENFSLMNKNSDDLNPKVINGREAEEGEFPWMVSLHYEEAFFCSAFLVSPNFVMTAAHCLKNETVTKQASALHGNVGNIRRQGPNTRIQFSQVIVHPDFNPDILEVFDIAMLRTTESVPKTKYIQQICLPNGTRDYEKKNVQAMGWGSTNNEDMTETLMTTKLVVQNWNVCHDTFPNITVEYICVGADNDTGVCYGDSGGPLVYLDVFPAAVGVASSVSVPICGSGDPVEFYFYTSTAAHVDWIKQNVGEEHEKMCFV